MERLRKLFGIGQPPESHLQYQPVPPQSHTDTTTPASQKGPASKPSSQLPSDTSQSLMQSVENQIRKVVPLEEDDCLSCKIIGTSACLGTGVFVLYWGRRATPNYAGFKRFLWRGHYYSLAVLMFSAGICRFLDMGVFKKLEEGEEFDLQKRLTEDIEMFKGLPEKISSFFKKPEHSDPKSSKGS
ncbi:hypothetical protein ScPMuIL_013958 [Solemya velum]